MITNIKHKKDLITLDYNLRQVRFCKNISNHGEILFFDLSRDDVDAYEYLYNNAIILFRVALRDDLFNNLGIKVQSNKMEVIQ